jgi:hypothetical protein
MNKLRAKSASITRRGRAWALRIELIGGSSVAFPLSRIASLRARRPGALGKALHDVKVEDRGATIAWPQLDVDFSVAEMVPEYLGITTAAAVARRAGGAVSPAKASAARANGAKGGRPRKTAA